jgi:hypothetical protein
MTILHYVDAGFAMTAVLINSAFILLVLTHTSLTTQYVTFLLHCLAAMVWNFGDFMEFASADRIWFYFSLIGTGIIPAVMFHFVNALIRARCFTPDKDPDAQTPTSRTIWLFASHAWNLARHLHKLCRAFCREHPAFA